MKKALAIIAAVAMVLVFSPMQPAGAVVPTWDVTGTYEWVVLGTYHHDVIITTELNDGTFSGYGGYPAGSAPYTGAGQTTETITGQVVGNTFTMTTLYAGPYNPGYTVTVTGTIANDGTISGNVPWPWTLGPHKAVAADLDNDGVLNWEDWCAGTTADGSWDIAWGTNRWQVQGSTLGWYQNKPKAGATWGHDLAYTYGCNGHQILQLLRDELGDVMNGHWKYGLSSSVLQDFHLDLSDGVLDGLYYLETVTVPANDADGVVSSATLLGGYEYLLKATGTADAGDGITFDADYSFRVPTSTDWTDDVSTYEYLGDTLLDLQVNGSSVNWGAYNALHTYWTNYLGTGAPANFMVNDTYPVNNSGSLSVAIYAVI